MSWETVIGLEIHAQLSTKSKLFSGGSTEFGAESNTHVDLVDMGLPGVLPVANKEATLRKLGVVKDTISPDSVMGSGSLDEIVHAFNESKI